MAEVEDRRRPAVSQRIRQRLRQNQFTVSDFVRRWPEFEDEIRAAFERGEFERLPMDVDQTIATMLGLSVFELLPFDASRPR